MATDEAQQQAAKAGAQQAETAPGAGDRGEEDVKLIVLNYGKWKDSKAMSDFLRAQNVTFQKVQKARQLS
ncbi:hypothetical protein BBJ28_00014979, partial [Nothophytophthora sp. Chile5]